jgi:hypothetical protein
MDFFRTAAAGMAEKKNSNPQQSRPRDLVQGIAQQKGKVCVLIRFYYNDPRQKKYNSSF